jgi:hypothetical protein
MKYRLYSIVFAMTLSGSLMASNDLTGKHLFCSIITDNNSSFHAYGISFVSEKELDIKTLRDEWREDSSDIIINLKDSLFAGPIHEGSYIRYEVDNNFITIIKEEVNNGLPVGVYWYSLPLFGLDRKTLILANLKASYQCELTSSENLEANLNERAKLVKEKHDNLRKGNKI